MPILGNKTCLGHFGLVLIFQQPNVPATPECTAVGKNSPLNTRDSISANIPPVNQQRVEQLIQICVGFGDIYFLQGCCMRNLNIP